jgi:hypothetical protein
MTIDPARKRKTQDEAMPESEAAKPQEEAAAGQNPQEEAAAAEQKTSAFLAELEALRLDESETQGLGGGAPILRKVPVRKPSRKEYFRCHKDPAMTTTIALYVDDGDDGDGEAYLVSKEMRGVFGDDVKPTLLQLSILRNSTVFVWPLKLPTMETNSLARNWYESALDTKDLAKNQWVKMVPNKSIKGYDVIPALGQIPEPEWPKDKSFADYLEIAFRGRIIKSDDHPIVRKFLGY